MSDQSKVYVKTEDGWMEGKVYVKTADGWMPGDGYTKTPEGWMDTVNIASANTKPKITEE
jgi:hypothetical protein